MAREEIRIDLEADAADAARDIEEVADAADDLEALDPKVTVTADTDAAEADLRAVREKAEQTEKAVEGIGTRGAGPAANAIADLTGPLGEASSMASDFGGALEGAGEIAEGLAGKLGASAEQAAGIGAAIGGPVALGVAGVAAAWGVVQAQQAKAREEAEKMARANREIATALREGAVNEAAEKLTDQYADLFDKADTLGVSVQQLTSYLTGQADALELLATGTREGALLSAELADAAGAARSSFQDANVTLDEAAARQRIVADTLRGTTDASLAQAQATADLEAAYRDLAAQLSDDRAYLDAQQGFDDVAAAAGEAFGTAVAGSAEAEQAARDHQRAVLDLKADVIGYAEEVGDIPAEQTTAILADIDAGKLAEAEAALAALEAERRVPVTPVRGAGWSEMERWFSGGFAGGARSVTNVTVNAPRGTRPAELVAAADAYARRNGRR